MVTLSRRLLLAGGVYVVATVLLMPISVAYILTHAARLTVPAADLGAPYKNVEFRTSDGLQLRGWYIASRNGAAVISFPGPGVITVARETTRPSRLWRAAFRSARRGSE